SASAITAQYAVTLHSSSPGSTPSLPAFLISAFCSASVGRLPPRTSEHDADESRSFLVTSLTTTPSFSPSAVWNAEASISCVHGTCAWPGTGVATFLAGGCACFAFCSARAAPLVCPFPRPPPPAEPRPPPLSRCCRRQPPRRARGQGRSRDA